MPEGKEKEEQQPLDVQPYLDYIEVVLSIYHEGLDTKGTNEK